MPYTSLTTKRGKRIKYSSPWQTLLKRANLINVEVITKKFKKGGDLFQTF